MEVIPAIDLRGGRCVRLYQGDFGQETVYSEDPLAVARQWQEQGASRLHLVDLDGAAQGEPVNLEIIAAIVAQSEIPVQVGGGVRSSSTAEKLLSIGVERVVIGTAAVRNPDLVRQLCQDGGSPRVVVAVDARDGLVAVQGWLEKTSVTAVELGKHMAELGVERLLYTDISRDGTLSEPNFSANAQLVESTGLAILASGGVASLDHITELAKIGAEGVIVGRALYTGDLELPEAIAAGLAGG
jgi:phosphoribosylformimino-5-aminoimidazole carboxamide ribotide isomerase